MSHLRRLEYFVIVAEELNFQRAADRLNITQPALWRQIRDLEHELDVKLFNREPAGIRLTDAGRGYLADVRRILDQLVEARKRAHRIQQGQAGAVRIAFNEIAARQRCLPRYFQAFRAEFPEIELQLNVMMSQRQIEALDRREIDAGFLFHRPVEDARLHYRTILEDDHLVALPKGHRLSGRSKITLQDLANEALIMPSPILNRALHGKLMATCLAGGLVPRVIQHADNEHTLLNMVAAGMGVAFVNTSCRKRHADEVLLKEIEDFSIKVQLDLVWLEDNANAALVHFINLVSSVPIERD